MHSRIAQHRERRKHQKPGAHGLKEINWTKDYTPELSDHPRQHLTPLRQYADPSHVAHIATRDMINWPYAPASYQVFVMDGWIGNQLPGTHKTPWVDPQVNPAWARNVTQNHNNIGVQHRGSFGPQMSQSTTHSILQSVGQMWANVRSGNYGG
jgi:hypothetical protein